MRIDGEQETEGAADAVDVCGWLISLNLISMIVDPPDGRVPRVYRPNFASQFSRLESEGRSDVQREYRTGTTVRCCPRCRPNLTSCYRAPAGTLRVLVRASKRLRTRPSIANGPGPPITRAARQAI